MVSSMWNDALHWSPENHKRNLKGDLIIEPLKRLEEQGRGSGGTLIHC
jgi:hypothetical protein